MVLDSVLVLIVLSVVDDVGLGFGVEAYNKSVLCSDPMSEGNHHLMIVTHPCPKIIPEAKFITSLFSGGMTLKYNPANHTNVNNTITNDSMNRRMLVE